MSDESLFREVDEEVRREQLEKLWKRYGNLFIAFSVGLIVAVGAFKGWQYYQKKQAEAAGEAYVSALDLLDRGKADEARLRLTDLAGGKHKGAAVLARLRLAGMATARGKTDEAIAQLSRVADDAAADAPLRNAAKVRKAWLLAGRAKMDELKRLLAGLDVAGNPWRSAAREILALAAWRTGDLAAMNTYLDAMLNDAGTSPEARERARIMKEVIAPKLAAAGGRK